MSFRHAAALAVLLAACGSKKPPSVPIGISDQRVGAPLPKKPADVPALSGHVVASVGTGTIGPFFARRGAGDAAKGLVAWVTSAEGSGRRILVVPVGAAGEPRGGEKTVALVANDTTMLTVRPMRGRAPGFVVAWTSLTDRGESLWAGVLDDDGTPRGKALELTRTNDDVVWVDVVPTDTGAVCLWAEETRDGQANVTAAALGGDGAVRGTPMRVGRGVVGWHALEAPGGVGVSLVTSARTLSFQRLDADARLVGPAVPISTTPNVSGDVDVARGDGRFVFAWTDRSAGEASVVASALDDGGRAEPPRRVVVARGGAALLGLAHGAGGTAVLFEAPVHRKNERRRIHVGRLTPALAFEGKTPTFEIAPGSAAPEVAATASGFALLAPLRECEPGTAACEDAPTVATLIRLDPHGAILQREPFAFAGDSAVMGWGLECEGDACVALAASSGTPARIRTALVHSRVNVTPPREPERPKDAPRIEDAAVVASGAAVVDLAATKLGGVTVLATLTAKDDKKAPLVLATRVLDANGAPSPATVLSNRALAIGGVAVAPAGKPDDGGAVAWVARDNGDPEVHVTRIDKNGKRTNDVQLTTTKGDASDVAIAWAGDGWIVAWVDGRAGNGEIFATKIGPSLNRIAREERITNAPGDASDLVALASGDRVWLAWADPRESPRDGVADVFVTAVSMHDAKRAIDEIRVAETAAHSRTPALVAGRADDVHVAWIEEAPLGSETPSSSGFGAMWATIDAHGKLVGKPARVPQSGEGAATSIALEAHGADVRAVVARSTPDAIWLDAVDLGAAEPRAFALLALDGPPSLDVALVLRDGLLFFNDDGPAPQDKRARRARIAWAPKTTGQGG